LTIRDAGTASAPAAAGVIRLEIVSSGAGADEGYELTIAAGSGIRIAGKTPAGGFYGVPNPRQLPPPGVAARGARPWPITVPAAHIVDQPRFAWRGAMLDVARHFFKPADVKRYLDLLAFYKFNHLHLHLSDDQGWRIEIASWPNLTTHGGSTAV